MAVEITQSAKLPSADFIFGSTPAMREVRMKLELAQDDDLPVLIEGENGTGKEVVARFLHLHSPRAKGAFVRLNCGAMPARLLEEEMFGSADGCRSRQDEKRVSSLGMAASGTLFLDEIGDLEFGLQQRLVEVLETSSYAVESDRKGRVDVRIVCASSIELQKAIQSGRIAGSLAQAFGHRVRLLPLKERKQDIPEICEYLIDKFAQNFGRPVPVLNSYVQEAFQQWNWPGNIRELENWIARIVIFGSEEAIGLEFMRQIGARQPVRRHRAIHANSSRERRPGRRN